MTRHFTAEEQLHLKKTVLRIHEQGWGIAFGLVLGLGLFAATNFLLIKGGENVGQHLSLLGVYFPGYSVTVLGSFIGFMYAFVLGYALGRIIATVYNRLQAARR